MASWLLQHWLSQYLHTHNIFAQSCISMSSSFFFFTIFIWHSVLWNDTTLVSIASSCKFYICLLSNGLTSFQMKRYIHIHVKALLCVHTMNCKCCLHHCKVFCNVVLQCLLIYYGYYIWIYLMTQDIVDFIVFFSFFLLVCGYLDRCH